MLNSSASSEQNSQLTDVQSSLDNGRAAVFDTVLVAKGDMLRVVEDFAKELAERTGKDHAKLLRGVARLEERAAWAKDILDSLEGKQIENAIANAQLICSERVELILESLKYSEINRRYIDIPKATSTTFDWVWDRDRTGPHT